MEDLKILKRWVWLLLATNVTVIALLVDTRLELVANANVTYDSITSIMHDLTTRKVGQRFSRDQPAAY